MPRGLLALALLAGVLPAQIPRARDGRPDLQGIWTNNTLTPLERPAEFAGKPVLSEQEAAEYEKRLLREGDRDRRDGGAAVDVNRAYNEAWFDRGTRLAARRTSLIVDPPDGRLPPLTPAAQKLAAERNEYRRMHPADRAQDRSLTERCIIWGTSGPPMLPGPYNNFYQIIQTPGYVMILVEMIHDVRIIPLDGSPHPPANIRLWMGDSRGHWEGDTLVVDTTNFTAKTNFRGSGENLHVIERFTRADSNTLLYEFTVDDPSTFTRTWKAVLPMAKAEGQIYEYACHEGNYALRDILAGARAQEAEQRK